MTFLLIEHNMDLVMQLCDPVVVMAQGRIVVEGSPQAVRADPRVIDAYLAKRHDGGRGLRHDTGRRRRPSAADAATRQPLLEAAGVVAGYARDLPIVQGVDSSVGAGEILVVLGPNGAGKSTLAKAVAGVVPVFAGSVRLDGSDIANLPAHRITASGVGFVPQTGNVFTTLSVEENLRVGGYLVKGDLGPRLRAAYERFPGPGPTCAGRPAMRSPAGSARCWRSPAR